MHPGSCRRQPDQVQTQAANQGHRIRFRGGHELFLVQPGEDEAIDGIADPLGLFDLWQRRPDWFDVSPMRFLDRFRPACALIDPGLQKADLLRCQPLARPRHDFILIHQPSHAQDDLALSTLAGNEKWFARIPALEGPRLVIQTEPALGLFFAVAFVAATGKDRLDVPGKIHLHRGGGRQWRRVGGPRRNGQRQEPGHPRKNSRDHTHLSRIRLFHPYHKRKASSVAGLHQARPERRIHAAAAGEL